MREKEINELVKSISNKTGLPHQPVIAGETVHGIYRQRFSLASGRYVMLDSVMGFRLVPWAPSMEKKLGQHIGGVIRNSGGIEWNLAKTKDLSL